MQRPDASRHIPRISRSDSSSSSTRIDTLAFGHVYPRHFLDQSIRSMRVQPVVCWAPARTSSRRSSAETQIIVFKNFTDLARESKVLLPSCHEMRVLTNHCTKQ